MRAIEIVSRFMYQQQLTNLIHTFIQSTGNRYRASRMLNDSDYRNRILARAAESGNNKISLLVKQIHMYEDLLGHELRVDRIPQQKTTPLRKTFHMSLFILSSLLFVGGSVYAFEEIKHQRALTGSQQD